MDYTVDDDVNDEDDDDSGNDQDTDDGVNENADLTSIDRQMLAPTTAQMMQMRITPAWENANFRRT